MSNVPAPLATCWGSLRAAAHGKQLGGYSSRQDLPASDCSAPKMTVAPPGALGSRPSGLQTSSLSFGLQSKRCHFPVISSRRHTSCPRLHPFADTDRLHPCVAVTVPVSPLSFQIAVADTCHPRHCTPAGTATLCVLQVSCCPNGVPTGYTLFLPGEEQQEARVLTRAQIEAQLVVSLAGRWALRRLVSCSAGIAVLSVETLR